MQMPSSESLLSPPPGLGSQLPGCPWAASAEVPLGALWLHGPALAHWPHDEGGSLLHGRGWVTPS